MASPATDFAPALPVGLEDVQAAAMRIEGAVVRTPTLISKTLSELTGATVYLKFENLQFTAAYKERGALNTLLQLDEAARSKGVIAASAGNHAQGLAYHATRLGIPSTIVMPKEIPISTGEALSNNFDNAFRTIQRQNVGIQLEVTPQINSGGAIKLFLRQEVSSIAGPVSNNSADLILNKREIQTTITVDDGEIVALGGLLDDNERRTIEKIPLLGDIPVIGELFKSRSRSRNKTNLMVFIRPTIVRSAAEARAIAEQRYGYARREQLIDRPDREPTLDELVRDYLGTVPPTVAPLPGDQVIQPAPSSLPVQP